MSEYAWKKIRGGGVTVTMPVGVAITKTNTPVELSGGAVQPAGDGDTVWGVALNKAVSGDLAVVALDGVYEVQAASGVNLAPGAAAYLAASFEVDAGTSLGLSCGNVVDFDPASAGIVRIQLTPAALQGTTHA